MSAALQWALALNLSESILEPQEKKEREIEEGNSKKKKLKKREEKASLHIEIKKDIHHFLFRLIKSIMCQFKQVSEIISYDGFRFRFLFFTYKNVLINYLNYSLLLSTDHLTIWDSLVHNKLFRVGAHSWRMKHMLDSNWPAIAKPADSNDLCGQPHISVP